MIDIFWPVSFIFFQLLFIVTPRSSVYNYSCIYPTPPAYDNTSCNLIQFSFSSTNCHAKAKGSVCPTIYPTPPGCDIRECNLIRFLFSLTRCHAKVKGSSLPYNLLIIKEMIFVWVSFSLLMAYQLSWVI